MPRNEQERRVFMESKECEAGIRLLRRLSRELDRQNEDDTSEKRGAIVAIMGILERNRQKALRESRSQLMSLKTKLVVCQEADKRKKETMLERTEERAGSVSGGVPGEEGASIRVFQQQGEERLGVEVVIGRSEIGSWEDPIPSNHGIPCDHFERKIFDKYVDYWKNSKLSVPFSTWMEECSSSVMSFKWAEVSGNVGCKSIQEAIYRVRRFEQDFRAIPREIVFPIIRRGMLASGSENMLRDCSRSECDRLELNRAKIRSQNREFKKRGVDTCGSPSFNVPQSLFFSMVVSDHEQRQRRGKLGRADPAAAKQTNLVSVGNTSGALSGEREKQEQEQEQELQCGCDFYGLRQRFIQEYNLLGLVGASSNFEKLDKSSESNLRLWMGAYYLPRNDKRLRGGEDGWFLSEDLQCMGVADGVGEWEDLSGKSARMFSNSIMKSSLEYIRSNRRRGTLEKPSFLAKNSLRESLLNCEKEGVHGASTALVACFDHHSGVIGFANMGDSGALVLRRLQYDTGKLEIVRRVKEMQHEFNCPYQFAALPPENEWPELIEKGYHDIVRLASIEKKSKEDPNLRDSDYLAQLACDDPELSQLLEVPLKEGDMVILGTDGLFDNLFDFEITSVSGLSFSPIESKLFYKCLDYTTTPMVMAKSIALSAYYKSLDPFSKTPFANQAKRFHSGGRNSLLASQSFSGGKEDDISVLVAWVVHKDDFETLTKSSPHYCDILKKL